MTFHATCLLAAVSCVLFVWVVNWPRFLPIKNYVDAIELNACFNSPLSSRGAAAAPLASRTAIGCQNLKATITRIPFSCREEGSEERSVVFNKRRPIKERKGTGCPKPDIPGQSGSASVVFSQLPGSCLIGVSHFPDSGPEVLRSS